MNPARFGWSYLLVWHDCGCTPEQAVHVTFCGHDGTHFVDEIDMLQQLGSSGWELITLRDETRPDGKHRIHYYFKRPRT